MEPRLILAVLAVLVLAGCASTGSFCEIAKPIRPTSQDVLTTDLARQILEHDKTGEGLCRWRP